jgi:hypothetical protein
MGAGQRNGEVKLRRSGLMRENYLKRISAACVCAALLLAVCGCGKDEHYHSLSSKGAIKKINSENKK